MYFASADSITFLPQKSMLEDTSDSGSSKEIAEEYGLPISYKFWQFWAILLIFYIILRFIQFVAYTDQKKESEVSTIPAIS